MTGRGRLIAFEGGEACGKSTQSALLANRVGALVTREPGGTALGERVRALLLDAGTVGLDPRAEALLMAAARAQHVAEVVAPALATGRHVVTDRFSHSSLAYQGYGRGLDLDELRWLSDWATASLWPDVVILLDLPPGRALSAPSAPDRFETESGEFHDRVTAGFHALAATDPERWRVVDAAGSVNEVAERVWAAVAPILASEDVR
ncbi:MAG TPA: dTMP kinase [Acidimicrobiales bacterium]|nr:dTMP kinase [Acidimicrobiales bacterium]